MAVVKIATRSIRVVPDAVMPTKRIVRSSARCLPARNSDEARGRHLMQKAGARPQARHCHACVGFVQLSLGVSPPFPEAVTPPCSRNSSGASHPLASLAHGEVGDS